ITAAQEPTETYTLSLHDALPIFAEVRYAGRDLRRHARGADRGLRPDRRGGFDALRGRRPHLRRRHGCVAQVLELAPHADGDAHRSEEHTSELQSRENLVCRLLLE